MIDKNHYHTFSMRKPEEMDLIEPKTAEELARSFEVFFVPMAEVMADNIEREVFEFVDGSEVGDCAKS